MGDSCAGAGSYDWGDLNVRSSSADLASSINFFWSAAFNISARDDEAGSLRRAFEVIDQIDISAEY